MWDANDDATNFQRNYSIGEVEVTDKAIDMKWMFCDCPSLKEIDISNFNITGGNDIYGMFSRCSDELRIKIKSQIINIDEKAFK